MLPEPALLLKMLLPAFSIAIIGLIQGAGVSQAYPNPDGKYPNVSRDFLGQGVANMGVSLVSGIPGGGSISGTALIMGAGAQSRWANIFAGVFVAVVVLVAAPLVEMVPMPALAALLIVAGFQGLRHPTGNHRVEHRQGDGGGDDHDVRGHADGPAAEYAVVGRHCLEHPAPRVRQSNKSPSPRSGLRRRPAGGTAGAQSSCPAIN